MGTTQSNGTTNSSTLNLENKVNHTNNTEQNQDAPAIPISECPMHNKTSNKFVTTTIKTNPEASKLDNKKLTADQLADNSKSPAASQSMQQLATPDTGSHASGSEEIVMENMVNHHVLCFILHYITISNNSLIGECNIYRQQCSCLAIIRHHKCIYSQVLLSLLLAGDVV